MDGTIRFAKILVEGTGDDCGVTRDIYHDELKKRALAAKGDSETVEQSYTRLGTTTEEGRLLFKAVKLAPVGPKPIQAAQSLKPEPPGPASKELNDMAAEMARVKGISFQQAHARLQSDPDRKELVARVREEERRLTQAVHDQRWPLWAAAKEFSR